MRYFLVFLAGLLLASGPARAQRALRVDFDSIRAATANPQSPRYFPALLRRFQAADTTLTYQDYRHLYYGQAATDHYAPYTALHADFVKLYNQENYAEAAPLGEKQLAENPLHLKLLFKLLVCYHQQGNRRAAAAYGHRYFALLDVIRRSGDGTSAATAYVVMAVPDEYELLRELELESSRQVLSGQTDILTVQPLDAQGKPTGKPGREVYFDVSQPLTSLLRSFKK